MRRRILPLLLAAMTLLLTACGGGEELVEEEEPWYAIGQEEESEAAEEGREGLSFFALAWHQDQTLDPITCSDGVQSDVASLLYEPLFALDETFQAENWLCDSYTVSEDGLTWILHIREGVAFSDGTQLSAGDAAACLRRAMASQRYSARLSGIQTVIGDSRAGEVTVKLSQPNAALPALLNIPIVKSGTEEEPVPVGTGPYLYITDGSTAYLAANGSWWRGTGQPVDRIELVNAKDDDTVRYLFTSKEIHLYAADLTGDSVTLTGRLDCVDAPTTALQYLGINAARVSNAAVRRALSAGIDRQKLVDGYLSSHGTAAWAPIHPASPLYPDSAGSYSSTQWYSAMTEAGLTDGEDPVTLTLLVNQESSEKVAMAQSVARSLSAWDLTVTVEVLPWEEYLAAVAAGNFDLYYGETRLTADWDLTRLLGTGGAMNYGGWSSQTTDSFLTAFRTAADRQQAGASLYGHLAQEMPLVPLCFKSLSVLTHSGTVEGLHPIQSNLFHALEDWTIHMAS